MSRFAEMPIGMETVFHRIARLLIHPYGEENIHMKMVRTKGRLAYIFAVQAHLRSTPAEFRRIMALRDACSMAMTILIGLYDQRDGHSAPAVGVMLSQTITQATTLICCLLLSVRDAEYWEEKTLDFPGTEGVGIPIM